MELRQLKYFVAVAEELNFGRAAGRVYLTQPALSQQIRKLEEDLGVTLFYRTRRQVELTDAGQALLEGARQALVQIEQTVRKVREVGGAGSSRLRVGFPEYANHTPVAGILQTFQRRYPHVELEQHEWFLLQHTLQLVSRLRNGALDVGFLLLPVDDDALAHEHVLSIEIVAAIPEDHPLAAEREVKMQALADERLILFSRRFHPMHYDHIVECCKEAGFSPDIVQKYEPQVYSGPTTYRMVASGAGIGIVVPPLVTTSRPPGIVFRPLRDPTPMLELVAAWRRNDPSSNLRAFLEMIREFAPVKVRASDSKLLLDSYASPPSLEAS
ncbi:MAG: LysR family transcriptional regulator [Actinobacteria bacterium]|nr:LysR family transcriptional regulator [Actinomycetota bacterium]